MLFRFLVLLCFVGSAFAGAGTRTYKDYASASAAKNLLEQQVLSSPCSIAGNSNSCTASPVSNTLPTGATCLASIDVGSLNAGTGSSCSPYVWVSFAYYPGACPAGYLADASGKCVEQCPVGGAMNVRAFAGGWSICDDDTLACVYGNYSVPAAVCDGSCIGTDVSTVSGTCSAADGATSSAPLPIYCDFSATKSGQTCTSSDNINPQPGTPPTVGGGSGTGDGSGTGTGTGDGSGDGSGTGTGTGSGDGSGTGTGTGAGSGDGTGTGGTGTGDSGSGGSCGDDTHVPCQIAGPGSLTPLSDAAAPRGELEDAWLSYHNKLMEWGTGSEAGAGQQTSFKEMWLDSFTPVPSSGCTPVNARIGTWYSWTFDPCSVAGQIAELLGFSLWVYLFFSTLRLVTMPRGK